MNKLSDQEVIAKILARDRKALASFYRTFAPKLHRFISSKVDNASDVEELLQDTLFAFLESIRDFEGQAKLKTFLFSICQHKIIDYYRRKKIKQLLFSQVPYLETLVSPILDPEETLDSAQMAEKIHRVMKRILPKYRMILESKYVEGLSVSDIAKKFAVSAKSAESQLFRARRAFVEIFISI